MNTIRSRKKFKRPILKRSREGTRLNDFQYFRQPRPHPRKKMTCLRIFPEENCASSNKFKKKEPPLKLNINQPSVEMATITYTSNIASLDSLRYNHETQVESEHLERAKLSFEKESQREESTQTNNPYLHRKNVEFQKAQSYRLHSKIQQQQFRPVSEDFSIVEIEVDATERKKRHYSRWGVTGLRRIFANFFGQLFGITPREKPFQQPEDRRGRDEAETSDLHRQNVGRMSFYRARSRAADMEEEDFVTNGPRFVKRDKSLRVAYINNVMKARKLEEENAEYRKVLHKGIRFRRSTSPLTFV